MCGAGLLPSEDLSEVVQFARGDLRFESFWFRVVDRRWSRSATIAIPLPFLLCSLVIKKGSSGGKSRDMSTARPG